MFIVTIQSYFVICNN